MGAFKRARGLALCCGLFLSLGGTQRLSAGFDDSGFIVDWLLFGPLIQSAGANPPPNIIGLDYLTDGAVNFEATILPKDGDELTPDYLGAAAAEGPHPILTDPPKWKATNSAANTIDFNAIYGAGSNVENAIVYAVAYIKNPQAQDVDLKIELASDDSIEVKLDDCVAFLRSIGRGFGNPGDIQDRATVKLSPGAHRLLVKVFNGGGGFGFRLRFADAATGTPVKDTTTPALATSLKASDFGLTSITPNGLDIARTIDPEKILGLDKTSTITLSGTKLFPALAGTTAVSLRETLPLGTSLVAGSAAPAPTSQNGNTLRWDIDVATATGATPITYQIKYDGEVADCIDGKFFVGNPAACSANVSGMSCVVAVPLNALFLGDIVGGGDGTGNKSPDICGIRLDTGILLTCANLATDNRHTDDTQGCAVDPNDPTICDPQNPQPVTEAPYVDSVFFLNGPNQDDPTLATNAINSKGVTFDFDATDLNPQNGGLASSWNHILSNITHDIDKGVGNIVCGGQGPFATGVGVHASAGVTFNLDKLRAKFGLDKIVTLTSLVGIDGCAGHTTQYIIWSNDTDILVDLTYKQDTPSGFAAPYKQDIPDDAKYVTFVTGTAGDGDGCDHGVWAEARIFPHLPVAKFTATPPSGPEPLSVNFDGSSSTAPAGTTLTRYDWDFGDSQTGTGAQVTHTYQARGKYTATLKVTNNLLLRDSTSQTIDVLFRSGSVAPFQSADIGTLFVAGGARQDNACYVVFAGGKDLTGVADECHYVYQQVKGNSSLTARVQNASWDPVGRAALMYRSTLDPGSPMAAMSLLETVGPLKAVFLSRATAGGRVVTQAQGGAPAPTYNPPDVFLKIERSGNELIGSVSTDGTFADANIVSRITLDGAPETMFLGLSVSARDTAGRGNSATVTFCGVNLVGGGPPPGGGFHRGDSDGNGSLQLTDAVRILNFLFLGTGKIDCLDAADADNNGTVQLTDAVRVLNVLFLGVGSIPDPGPPGATFGNKPCGPDPGAETDHLGCVSYNSCGG